MKRTTITNWELNCETCGTTKNVTHIEGVNDAKNVFDGWLTISGITINEGIIRRHFLLFEDTEASNSTGDPQNQLFCGIECLMEAIEKRVRQALA